jgi:capsule polysaccharide export protein KpsE/RkpR
MAQQFVRYVAEETVKLSRGESLATDREVIGEAERQVAEDRQKLDQTRHAWAENATQEPNGALQTQIESEIEIVAKTRQTLIDARSDIAEYQEKPELARELPGLKARASELDKKIAELEKDIEHKSAMASQREVNRQRLDVELKMAQTASESSAARLRDLRATAGTRGERLRVIDPGIVPQRPSSPNILLNVFAALLLTSIALIAYLTISFSYRWRRVE